MIRHDCRKGARIRLVNALASGKGPERKLLRGERLKPHTARALLGHNARDWNGIVPDSHSPSDFRPTRGNFFVNTGTNRAQLRMIGAPHPYTNNAMQSFPYRSLTALTFLMLAVTGCSSVYVPSFIKVYQPDIAQGNILEAKQVAQLKVGMDKSQVNQILGTPALKDIFHQNQRETYVFYDKRGKNKAFKHILVVLYDTNGRVTKIEQSGDPLDQTPPHDLPETLRPGNEAAQTPAKDDKTSTESGAPDNKNPASDPYALTSPGNEPGLGSGQPLQPGGGL